MNKISSNSNSIVLMNGAVLECYPKESPQTDFVTDKIQLDTTGAMALYVCKHLDET